ncbi:MAG: type 4a pilus biogenesis protein PilO [Candidatus Campbellbacteria bacterium]|nr:type 4a pilus biogenesis protein PilO [Candidatus Campbellbacteria bacterium]
MRFISSIIFIILSLAIFFGFTNGRYEKTKDVRLEIARFDDALQKASDLAVLRDSLKEKFNSFSQNDLHRLDTLLPNTIDTVRLIIDINGIARRHDLTVLNIVVDGAADTSSKKTTIGPQEKPYGTILVSFNITTSYDRFKSFLGDLENSLRLIDVDSVTLGEENPITGMTTYAIRAKTYWLR